MVVRRPGPMRFRHRSPRSRIERGSLQRRVSNELVAAGWGCIFAVLRPSRQRCGDRHEVGRAGLGAAAGKSECDMTRSSSTRREPGRKIHQNVCGADAHGRMSVGCTNTACTFPTDGLTNAIRRGA
jgi:hypothetical protein